MKTKLRSSWLGLIVLFILGALLVPSGRWMKQSVKTARVSYNSRLAPVIFIPGSSATQDRFDDLIRQLNRYHHGHSLIKITVATDGQLKVSGHYRRDDLQPFIVVGFANNHDGYNNIKKQAKWFQKAMHYLVHKYHFNHFSGIGHSNGGLIYTLYLEKYLNTSTLQMNTLMTIGTPYNFSENNPNNRTEMLDYFIRHKKRLPKDLVLYSIAGTQDYRDDGIVPIQSVTAGKYIYQKQIRQYTEITVTGEQSNHSELPQNKQIIRLIEEYVLDASISDTLPVKP